jgi:molybdenum cofactor cytidylyltransferase
MTEAEPTSTPFAGLILAGGEGRRWGGPKAWAQLPDGRTFLEACAEALAGGGAAPVAATLPPAPAGRTPKALEIVTLPEAGLDMFASLRQGLEALGRFESWRAVVVLPVDHPLVAPATVAALVSASAPVALPSFKGRHGHPLCLRRDLAEAVVDGRLPGPTLREVVKAAGWVDVAVEDPGVRANCNTPEALEAGLSSVGVA